MWLKAQIIDSVHTHTHTHTYSYAQAVLIGVCIYVCVKSSISAQECALLCPLVPKRGDAIKESTQELETSN